jgi:hypothetical protein
MSNPTYLFKRKKPEPPRAAILDETYKRGMATVIGYGAAQCYKRAIDDADLEQQARDIVSRQIGVEFERKLYILCTTSGGTHLHKRLTECSIILSRIEPIAPQLALLCNGYDHAKAAKEA